MIYEGLLGKTYNILTYPVFHQFPQTPCLGLGWHYFGGCKPRMMIQTQCYQSRLLGVITEQTQEGDKSMMRRIARQ